MRCILFLALFMSSLAYGEAFDTLVRKANEQAVMRVISVSDSQLSFQEASGKIISIGRPEFNDLMKRLSGTSGLEKLNAFLNGEPLDRSTHLRLQRAVVHASDFACVSTGGTCVFLAASSIVFWPNGVIAGLCGGLAWGCDKYASSIVEELNIQIKIEESKEVGGHGDPGRSSPSPPYIPGPTGGSGTIWFDPPRPTVIITDR